MKYIVIVPDGMADYPIKILNGKTPLEAAQTPNMDFIASHGAIGQVQTIPRGFPPGSDVGNLSIMGYNPAQCFSGRAPLEAANLGIDLKSDEIAFRCNMVTVINKKMLDYSADHISSDESQILIEVLNKKISMPGVRFYSGKSYRHLLVIQSQDPQSFLETKCTPPHDILGLPIQEYFPKGPKAQILLNLMEQSQNFLLNHDINQKRILSNKNPANMPWLWGQGKKPNLLSFQKKFGINGSVISAVDLVNGIGKLAGLEVVSVPGANGYYDTNYVGKAKYALNSLKEKDFVFIHIEAADEASHNGDLKMKISCIERIDQEVIGTVLNYFHQKDNFRILVLPDHYTPLMKRTHTSDPVCFEMFGKGISSSKRTDTFSERLAKESPLFFDNGEALMEYFIKKY